MPNCDGLQASRLIRELPSSIPIIALTASFVPEDHDKAMEVGMSDVLTKPAKLGSIQAAIEQARARATSGQTGRMFCICADDNPTNISVLEAMLSHLDIDLLPAADGHEVVGLVRKHGDQAQCACVFMDLTMPNCDGLQASRLIRELPSAIPIIALTASIMPEDHDKAREVGINSVLTKPANLSQIQEQLLLAGAVKKAPKLASCSAPEL
jgi:CheY-like chemotaxis protein